MTKVRIFVFLSTLFIVGFFGIFVSFYARGYRLNFKTLKFEPNGILVIKSEPDGASVYINKELKGATNTSLSLAPGNYDIEVKKDGFFPWSKRLSIDKEIVTNVTISLFKNVPSLSPITFSGATNPAVSQDGTKIAFLVPASKDPGNDKEGLWSLDTFNFPLGFSSDPKRITDGDLTGSTYVFSPDSRQILLTTSNGIFLLDSGSFVSQSQRINIASRVPSILAQWENEKKIKNESLIRNLPPDVADILTRKSETFTFSPDETMILYTASTSGILPNNLIAQLPGSSTQKQERSVNAGSTYVYDIKEDRNFLITDEVVVLGEIPSYSLRWMPSSKHILLAQPNQVVIMDYDGTNRQVIYSGSYFAPFAFPYRNSTKLLILTNLGAASLVPNLYTLTVK
ncbi:MAG: PEGA domain-containing protein [Candidatus Woesebacteria bacterium]|nr:MAG: PEGA domain-containing protein [Candidatus Woesebacteria bacterium]